LPSPWRPERARGRVPGREVTDPRARACDRAIRLADAFAGLGMLGYGGALAYTAARDR